MRFERCHARRRPAGRVTRLVAALLLAAAPAWLAACGGLGEDNSPPEPFGAGTGGPAVPQGTVQSTTLADIAGDAIGTLDYDDGYFAFTPTTPTEEDPSLGQLVNATDGVGLQVLLISGRPDTPCRFDAARAARDDGFTIIGDGEDRVNDADVEFHEVRLEAGDRYLRLVCAELKGRLGIEVRGLSTPTDQLGTEQVHFVLNSIRP